MTRHFTCASVQAALNTRFGSFVGAQIERLDGALKFSGKENKQKKKVGLLAGLLACLLACPAVCPAAVCLLALLLA